MKTILQTSFCRFSRPLAALLLLVFCLPHLSGCNNSSVAQPNNFDKTSLPDESSLKTRIDHVVQHTLKQRRLNTTDHAAWQIVHAILAYGNDLEIEHEGKLVPALKFILDGNRVNGWNLRPGTKGIYVPLEAASKAGQGHPDQWLGYLSQLKLPPNTPVVVWGQTFHVRDLLTQAQYDITDGMEATWTLMALSQPDYWPLDKEWEARNGEKWTIERVAEMEANAPIVGGACGGTHRLQALTLFVNRMVAERGDKANSSSAFVTAKNRINEMADVVRDWQNADGSFSCHFFARPGIVVDMKDRIDTTGHIFEFLTMALDDQELSEPWMVKACERLVTMMEKSEQVPLDCGGLYHTAHGLAIYRERRWGPPKVE